nr:aminotransferase class I/II-fold pyridoxal phosphate-dependent enzyme [Corynebacterium diphtheriae]
MTPQTRMIIVNSPHNPTGLYLARKQLPSCAP